MFSRSPHAYPWLRRVKARHPAGLEGEAINTILAAAANSRKPLGLFRDAARTFRFAFVRWLANRLILSRPTRSICMATA